MRNRLVVPSEIVSQSQWGFLFANESKLTRRQKTRLHNNTRGRSLKDLPIKDDTNN